MVNLLETFFPRLLDFCGGGASITFTRPAHSEREEILLGTYTKRWKLGDHPELCLPHYQYHFSTGSVLRFMFDFLLLIHTGM